MVKNKIMEMIKKIDFEILLYAFIIGMITTMVIRFYYPEIILSYESIKEVKYVVQQWDRIIL